MPTKKLKFLADESLEYSLVLHLRKAGYDIISISEDFPSIKDEEVLEKAYSQERIVITNDKDYGDLIFLNHLPHKSVVLFRLKSEQVEDKIRAGDLMLKNYGNQLSGNFVVVEEDKVRIRFN